jgi:hypothetical protein
MTGALAVSTPEDDIVVVPVNAGMPPLVPVVKPVPPLGTRKGEQGMLLRIVERIVRQSPEVPPMIGDVPTISVPPPPPPENALNGVCDGIPPDKLPQTVCAEKTPLH